jgi:hypothetical protein
MILPDTPAPWVYCVSDPIRLTGSDANMDALLRGLSFHPQTCSIYQAAGGLRVREGTDTLRISDTGTVIYHASDRQKPRYSVSSAGETPDRGEMVEAARALAESGMGTWCGDAGLYLIGTETMKDASVAVYFGYLLDGAAVQLYEDGYAARVVISGGIISDFTFHFRNYQKTETRSAVLPEIQAVAAMNALKPEAGELMLCYLDGGGTQVTAGWVAK